MEYNNWELVLIGLLGHKERVLDTGLSYNKAKRKYDYLKRGKLDKSGTIIIRKAK